MAAVIARLAPALFLSLANLPAAAQAAGGAQSVQSGKIQSLVFVDAAVRDRAVLVRNLPNTARLVIIGPGEDPFDQMARAAAGHSGLQSISILSHATPGKLHLSGADFDADALRRNGAALATLAQSLSKGGDILLYGCDLAAGSDGGAFVETLAALTGRDVAASSDSTGIAALGGNWTLEVASGPVAFGPYAQTGLAAGWNDLLAITVTTATSATAMRDAMGNAATNGITYVGTPTLNAPVSSNAFGTFTTSGSNLGISSGAVLGTGDVTQVPGTPSTFWDGVGTGVVGTGSERDVAALSYQFTPNTGVTKVVFQIVMGSEEYNDFVGQGFSDNIRILLSGGVYSNTNVAVVPGTSTGIDIDTINAGLNSAYYRDNTVATPPVPDSVLDGHTTVINTVVPVVPGTTYTSTTTVADFIDQLYNTAAFLGFFGASINLDLDIDNSSGATGTAYNTTFTQGGAAVAISDADTSVINYDTTSIQSATITLTNARSGDSLSIGTLPGGITGSVNTSTPGVITVTLTGSSSAANYQTAIHAVTFQNSAFVPDTTLRNVTVVVNDGTTNSNTAVTSISVVNTTTPSGNEFCTGTNLANNGSFETPVIPAGTFTFSLSVPGWTNTDPSGIELWPNGYNSIPSHTAAQFVELNGTGAYLHTQTSNTVQAGAQLDIYFAHRARSGTDTASLSISDNGGGSTVFGNFSSSIASRWVERWATHVVSASGSVAQLDFQPVSTGSGDNKIGNFLDSIEICQTYLTLSKSFVSKTDTNGDSRDSAGDTITYEFSIANPAGNNRALTAISITDDKIGSIPVASPLSGDANSDNALDPGETWVVQASHVLTQSELDKGSVTNVAHANGSTGSNTLQSGEAQVTVPVTQNPSLAIAKSILPATVVPVSSGQTIVYEYLVTNNGNVTLYDVGVEDTHEGNNTPPVPGSETLETPNSGTSSDASPSDGIWTSLAPGDRVLFTASYTVNQADVDANQ
jgi:hypothetical protein